jgi:hypothetical protein
MADPLAGATDYQNSGACRGQQVGDPIPPVLGKIKMLQQVDQESPVNRVKSLRYIDSEKDAWALASVQ